MLGTVMLGLALSAGQAGALSAPPEDPPALQCEVGPLKRAYGGAPWLVYSCSDGASLVVVSDEGNPAAPFYFMIYAQDGSYQLGGEGSKAKHVTDAAFEDLKALTPDAIVDLVRETKAQQQSKGAAAAPAVTSSQ
jgi:ABC-type Fe3+-hydroxamate transport system substrate-binding protein